MSTEQTRSYAKAMAQIAEAEGCLDEVADEMFRFSRALQGSDELREALSDRHIPVQRRQQIVEDLLASRATPATVGMLSLIVASERSRDIAAIAEELADIAASAKSAEVAYVRAAVPLSEDQIARLRQALSDATGKNIEVKASVDPTAIGGIVTTVGDTVIDGSVRSRLAKLRDAFTG